MNCLEDNRNIIVYVLLTEIIWRTFEEIIDDDVIERLCSSLQITSPLQDFQTFWHPCRWVDVAERTSRFLYSLLRLNFPFWLLNKNNFFMWAVRIKFLLFSRFLISLFFQKGIQIMKYDSAVVERLKYSLNITNLPIIESIVLKFSKFQK